MNYDACNAKERTSECVASSLLYNAAVKQLSSCRYSAAATCGRASLSVRDFLLRMGMRMPKKKETPARRKEACARPAEFNPLTTQEVSMAVTVTQPSKGGVHGTL